MTSKKCPWDTQNISDFTFICCPEPQCNFRTQDEPKFLEHARKCHQPDSFKFLCHKTVIKQEPSDFLEQSLIIKSEPIDQDDVPSVTNNVQKAVNASPIKKSVQKQKQDLLMKKLKMLKKKNILLDPLQVTRTIEVNPRERHHDEYRTKYLCAFCDLEAVNRTQLESHINLWHQDGRAASKLAINCDQCEVSFTTIADLLRHKSLEHKPKLIGKNFKKKMPGKKELKNGVKKHNKKSKKTSPTKSKKNILPSKKDVPPKSKKTVLPKSKKNLGSKSRK